MSEALDSELLAEFARNDSEAAFTALVRRHIALVHSVALRHTADPQRAQDITQAVFIILARKAGTLGRKTVLPGWLYHTARLTAANFQRAETRRVRREQEAFMQSGLEESAPDAADWRELSPLLDDVMKRLSALDRDALVLRYFENKSLSEVGAALGLGERAAQKRVSRALERARKFLGQRGVALSVAAIAGAVSAHSVQAAPAVLAQTVSTVALTKGASATASTLTLVKGALKIMAWTKMKTAALAGAAVLLAAGTTVITIQLQHRRAPGSQPETRSPTEYPRTAWRFAGYADPEAALESILWAMSQGDVKAYLDALAPNGGLALEARGKSETELAAMGRRQMEGVTGFRIIDKKFNSATRVIVTFLPEAAGNQPPNRPGRIVIVRVGEDWKVSG